MTHGYAVTNKFAELGAGFYDFPTPALLATSAYGRDARMDKLMAVGSTSEDGGIMIDCGAATALVGIALLNHNIVTTGGGAPSIFVLADTVNTFATQVTAKDYTPLNAVAPNNKDHIFLFPSVTKRYWRIAIYGMATEPFNLTVGEVFGISALTSLPRAAVYGATDREDLITVESQMLYGETRAAFYGGPVRELRRRFSDQSASDLAALRAMWGASKGPVTPLLWAENVNSTASAATAAEQMCVYGRLSVPSFESSQDDYGIYQPGEFAIRSLGREVGA